MSWPSGTFLRNLDHPEWGLGVMTQLDGDNGLAFFVMGGRRRISAGLTNVSHPEREARPFQLELLRVAADVYAEEWNPGSHNVYVVELDPVILVEKPRFARRNPNRASTGRCLYVGLTTRSPEERLRQHKEGHHAGRGFVRDFGGDLADELFRHFNLVPEEVGLVLEPTLAESLRLQGHAVWQN